MYQEKQLDREYLAAAAFMLTSGPSAAAPPATPKNFSNCLRVNSDMYPPMTVGFSPVFAPAKLQNFRNQNIREIVV